MKKILTLTAVVVVFAVPTQASANIQDTYSHWCKRDGYVRVTGLRATNKPYTTCRQAHLVLDEWRYADACDHFNCKIRVGADGWLWRCEGWRVPNQYRRLEVNCYSARQFYISNLYSEDGATFGGWSRRSIWFKWDNSK